MPDQPRISLAVIVRNAEGTIKQLLSSAAEYVDEICITFAGESTDETEKRIFEFVDATQTPGVKLSHFEWVDDFAAARNFNFSQCTGDYVLWLDADDLLVGGEHLKEIVSFLELFPQVDCVNAPYFYAKDQHGNWYSIVSRERVIRRSIFEDGARWLYRVHESVAHPTRKLVTISTTTEVQAGQQLSPDFLVQHNTPTDPEHHAQRLKRNYRLLSKQLRDPIAKHNPKVWFEMGKHLLTCEYPRRRWALKFFQKSLNWDLLPEEEYFVRHDMAQVYRERGELGKAMNEELACIALRPDWQDACIGMARIASEKKQPKKVLEWLAKAEAGSGVMDDRLGLNPVAYTFEVFLIKANAYLGLDDFEQADYWLNEALAIIPDNPDALNAKKLTAAFLKRQSVAKAVAMLAASEEVDPEKLVKLVPRYVFDAPGIRNLVFGPIHDEFLKTADVVIFCGPTVEPWAPESLVKGGIGGSETAVIHVAEGLANLGLKVLVYNDPGMGEGLYCNDKVGYFSYLRFREEIKPEFFVSWRVPELSTATEAKKKLLWCHDLNYGDRMLKPESAGYDLILGVSKWHADYLRKLYGVENVTYVPNGIDLSRFKGGSVLRNPEKYIYSSSADRGLPELLTLWPRVRGESNAELHVFYGFNTINARPEMRNFIEAVKRMAASTPGVVLRGRVAQDELAREMRESTVWLYPTGFVEVSCITAMEMQAAGVIPVASALGALTETAANGYLIPGMPRSLHYGRRFLSTVLWLQAHETERENLRGTLQQVAKGFSWGEAMKHWKRVLK